MCVISVFSNTVGTQRQRLECYWKPFGAQLLLMIITCTYRFWHDIFPLNVMLLGHDRRDLGSRRDWLMMVLLTFGVVSGQEWATKCWTPVQSTIWVLLDSVWSAPATLSRVEDNGNIPNVVGCRDGTKIFLGANLPSRIFDSDKTTNFWDLNIFFDSLYRPTFILQIIRAE